MYVNFCIHVTFEIPYLAIITGNRNRTIHEKSPSYLTQEYASLCTELMNLHYVSDVK